MRAELHQALLCVLAGALSCGALAHLGLLPSIFKTSCSVPKPEMGPGAMLLPPCAGRWMHTAP